MYCLQFSICLEVLSRSTKIKLLRLFVFRWEDPIMTASPLPACVIIVQQGETGTTLPFSETGRNQKLFLQRDLPGGGVYDCIKYGTWGQTSCFLLANSLFPPHESSKTAGSAVYYSLLSTVSPGKTVYLIYRHPHSLAQSCYIMSLE
jgi:hypothetical protein